MNRSTLKASQSYNTSKVQAARSAWLVLLVALLASGPAFGSGWQQGLEGIEIGRELVRGQLHGEAFELEKVELQHGILTLRQGEDFFADRQVTIFLFLDEGESVEKKQFVVSPGGDGMSPHVHMNYKVADQDLPETEIFMSDYTMKLQFASVKEGKVTGRIYLALPDQQKSWLTGYFKADLDESQGSATEQTTLTLPADSEGPGNDLGAPTSSAASMDSLIDSADGDLTMVAPMEAGSQSLPLLAMILMGIGSVLGLIGGVWLVVKGFQEHWAWGLACLTPIALIFFVLHFKKSYRPVLVSILGLMFTAGGWASAIMQLGF